MRMSKMTPPPESLRHPRGCLSHRLASLCSILCRSTRAPPCLPSRKPAPVAPQGALLSHRMGCTALLPKWSALCQPLGMASFASRGLPKGSDWCVQSWGGLVPGCAPSPAWLSLPGAALSARTRMGVSRPEAGGSANARTCGMAAAALGFELHVTGRPQLPVSRPLSRKPNRPLTSQQRTWGGCQRVSGSGSFICKMGKNPLLRYVCMFALR